MIRLKRWFDRIITVALAIILIPSLAWFFDILSFKVSPVFKTVIGIVIMVFTMVLAVIFVYDLTKRLKLEKNERGEIKPIVKDGIWVAFGIMSVLIFFLI